MDTQIQTTRPRREPRLGSESNATKAQRLATVLPKALKRIASQPPVNARSSAALSAIRPRADEILEVLARGHSANAIATVLADEDGDNATFSVETIRVAIKRLQAETASKPIAPRTVAQSAPVASKTVPANDAVSRQNEDL